MSGAPVCPRNDTVWPSARRRIRLAPSHNRTAQSLCIGRIARFVLQRRFRDRKARANLLLKQVNLNLEIGSDPFNPCANAITRPTFFLDFLTDRRFSDVVLSRDLAITCETTIAIATLDRIPVNLFRHRHSPKVRANTPATSLNCPREKNLSVPISAVVK